MSNSTCLSPYIKALLDSPLQIHLWKFQLNQSVLNRLNNDCKKIIWLSGDELASLQKLPSSVQIEYFAQKIFQKYVLSLYTQVSPKNIKVNFQHKPQLEFSENFSDSQVGFSSVPLCYNLSHTENLSVMALATREIGVDLEKIRSVAEKSRLNSKVFSKDELKLINQDSNSSDISFWKLWTLKEAFLKWQGLGLQSNFSILPRLNFIEKKQGVYLLQNHVLNRHNSNGKINPETAIFLQKRIDHTFIVSVCNYPNFFTISNGINCQTNFSNSESGNFYKQTLKMETITPEKIEIFEFNHPHCCEGK